jgi:hypothetical protein
MIHLLKRKISCCLRLAGEKSKEGELSERVKEANEKNDQRLKEGDWRALEPAVGPQP